MIRICSTNDLPQCVEIAFARNNEPQNNSAYCPKLRDGIHADFAFLLDNVGSVLLGDFDGDAPVGLMGCFFNPENGWVDCSGPFFVGAWDEARAQALFAHAQNTIAGATRFNFFFDTRNAGLHELMTTLRAHRNDNEYVLSLAQADYKPQPIKHTVVAFEDSYKDAVLLLKNDTWAEAYLTDSELIGSISNDRDIFCTLDEEGAFVGYGVLKRYADKQRMTAEVFAVAAHARGRGYGWALLNAVINAAFDKYDAQSVDLVVDKLNDHARKLYFSCGFKLNVENASYHITPSH
ncbi:MAG: GNAT family N-acetyltransferase [Defluviitaleaceae bacterium]|nr:GNAT family N-acetyltransferase [Defluviitaleaceae bacterium]